MVDPILAESATGAILVLVATLLGALIGSGSTFLLEHSKRRGEARAVARLVEDELAGATKVVEAWLASLQGAPKPSEKSRAALDSPAWREGRTVLAHALSRRRWDTVRKGCGELDRLRRSLEDGTPLSQNDFARARGKVVAASDTLRHEGTVAPLVARLRAWTRAAGAKILRLLTVWRTPADGRQPPGADETA